MDNELSILGPGVYGPGVLKGKQEINKEITPRDLPMCDQDQSGSLRPKSGNDIVTPPPPVGSQGRDGKCNRIWMDGWMDGKCNRICKNMCIDNRIWMDGWM